MLTAISQSNGNGQTLTTHYNVTSRRPCNDTSHMNLSGYAGRVTIFILMFTIACCLVVGSGLGLGLGVDLVSVCGWCNYRL